MGQTNSNWCKELLKDKKGKILLLGLDNSGKTLILEKLKLKEPELVIPTLCLLIEKIIYENIEIISFDLSGGDKIRKLWNHYYLNTNCLIFVIDSRDRERLENSRDELFRLLECVDLKDCKSILILANKQDEKDAMDLIEIRKGLNISEFTDREIFIQSCSAVKEEGLFEGFQWVRDHL